MNENIELVAGRHPLKQGLKLRSHKPYFIGRWVAGRHPLKQGLKLYLLREFCRVMPVAGRHPLKQGLKLVIGTGTTTSAGTHHLFIHANGIGNQ